MIKRTYRVSYVITSTQHDEFNAEGPIEMFLAATKLSTWWTDDEVEAISFISRGEALTFAAQRGLLKDFTVELRSRYSVRST